MLFYPKGGWMRAASYVSHRLRRLPDSPERIAKGIGAGICISFTPLFGLHFLGAALIAWLVRGNILASLLATFFGNPLTFPIIFAASTELGSVLLGAPEALHLSQLTMAFGQATGELSANFWALVSGSPLHWERFFRFFHEVFLPYLLGGLVAGSVAGVIGYFVSLPLIRAYQARRRKKMRERFERVRQQKAVQLSGERDS
ncbi:DUF2062 domain-containing protein [Roseicitreum antarcticum]|nr:DUF2062 domain-containing protein [Roseicitreum antarcticum]